MKPIWGCVLLAVLGCGQSAPAKPEQTPPESEPPQPVSLTPPKSVEEPQRPKGFNEYRINQVYDLKKTTVTIGKHKFACWVANNDGTRTEGMMFLTAKEVKDTEGMLFAFPDEQQRSFWMRNTLIDLDIAYIRKDGTLVSVKTMKSLDETGVPSEGPAMYALEVKSGVLKKLGIRKGMRATISPPVKGE